MSPRRSQQWGAAGGRKGGGATKGRTLGPRPPRDATPRIPGGAYLEVTCWCETEVIEVHRDLLAAGLTRSCGAPHCSPPSP